MMGRGGRGRLDAGAVAGVSANGHRGEGKS